MTQAQEQGVVLVADLVESVRLLAQAEGEVIARWERLIGALRGELLPRHRGALVKSLGDGVMLTFADAHAALACAGALLAACAGLNQGHAARHALQLRIGLHACDWTRGALDIYGEGVNLCARLAALAPPGGVVVASPTLAAFGLALPVPWQLRDLGNCYLKHIDQPVSCHLLQCLQVQQDGTRDVALLRPLLAVLPVQCEPDVAWPAGATEVLRDDLVRALAAVPHWQVVSRLSTQVLRAPGDLGDSARGHLWVHVQLGGSPQSHATLTLRLLDGGQELWSGHYELPWARLLQPEVGVMPRIVAAMDQALLRQGHAPLHAAALPNVPSYALLLRAVQELHRLRPDCMARARQMLEHLAERHPRAADVQGWLAKWHFLSLCQGLCSDAAQSLQAARLTAQRALELDTEQGVALTVRGQLLAYADRDASGALAALDDASARQPNEPMAWMYLANLQAMDEAPAALLSYEQAQRLAPMDPLGFEIDMMGTIAHLAVGDRMEALRLARRSVARNPLHLSSQVMLMIALVENGALAEARQVAADYRQRRPQASVQRYMDQHIAVGRPVVCRQGEALLAAGLPL